MDLETRVNGELDKGFCCSEIVMKIYLEEAEKNNPDLVKAMGAFCGGMDGNQVCGALVGACCAIVDSSEDKFEAKPLKLEFMEKFNEKFDGYTCDDLIGGSAEQRIQRCPIIIEETCYELIDFLEENALL